MIHERPYPESPQNPRPQSDANLISFYIKLAPPTVTYILIVLNLLAFVAEIVYGYWAYGDWNGSQNITVLVDLGAKVNEYIALGEYWRLFTAMFLHIGVLHLLFNLYALYALGTLVEGYYGHWRFAVIYLVGGLFGSLGSFIFSESVSAGASGAVFALTGAAAVYFFKYRENFGARGRAVLQNIVVVILVNLAFGAAGQGVDNWGHIGGLIGGLLLSMGLYPRYEALVTSYRQPDGSIHTAEIIHNEPRPMTVERRTTTDAIWIVVCLALLAAGVVWRSNQVLTEIAGFLGS